MHMMRNIYNFSPIVVHTVTQISTSELYAEKQGICNTGK